MISVVNKRNGGKGIYIGRGNRHTKGSPLGNPFKMKTESDRDKVVQMYERWLLDKMVQHGTKNDTNVNANGNNNNNNTTHSTNLARKEIFKLARLVQSGKHINLVCWCAPKRCHGDVIKDFVYRTIDGEFDATNTATTTATSTRTAGANVAVAVGNNPPRSIARTANTAAYTPGPASLGSIEKQHNYSGVSNSKSTTATIATNQGTKMMCQPCGAATVATQQQKQQQQQQRQVQRNQMAPPSQSYARIVVVNKRGRKTTSKKQQQQQQQSTKTTKNDNNDTINHDIYIGRGNRHTRGSPLGNPFKMKTENDRDDVVRKYKVWLVSKMKEDMADNPVKEEIMRIVDIVKGSSNDGNAINIRPTKRSGGTGIVNLVCWCAPKRCHGDVIKEVVEGIILNDTNKQKEQQRDHASFKDVAMTNKNAAVSVPANNDFSSRRVEPKKSSWADIAS